MSSSTKCYSSNVIAVLVTIIIVLLGLLALSYYMAGHSSYQTQQANNASNIGNANDVINDLKNKIHELENQLSMANNKIISYENQLNNLQTRVNELQQIVQLQKTAVLVNQKTISQPAHSYNAWDFSIDYPGYITVVVHSSSTTKTFVEVIYDSNGVHFDEKVNIGSSGSVSFPVLPGQIEVRVGNYNLINGATEEVSIVYHY